MFTHRLTRAARRTAVAAAVAAALTAAVAAPASATVSPHTSPHANQFTDAYSGPGPVYGLNGGFVANTSLGMICWTDSSYWSFGTNRWFWVYGFGIEPSGSLGEVEGYVSANTVSSQATVGHC